MLHSCLCQTLDLVNRIIYTVAITDTPDRGVKKNIYLNQDT